MSDYPKCPKCMSKNLHVAILYDDNMNEKDGLSCEECGYCNETERFHE